MYIKTEYGAFEWDDAKAEANLRKHGIRFEEAIRIFTGQIYTRESEGNYEEIREISIGKVRDTLIAAVIHTRRGKAKRIISARPAKREERAEFAAFIAGRY